MGGQITIGIRHTMNGKPEEVFMHRWTNDFPWRLMQPSFIDQGDELKRFIEEAKPNNEWPDSILLTKLENSEYGIVLIDFPSREIYSRQGYNEPGSLHYVARQSSADREIYSGIISLIQRGNIGKIERWLFNCYDTETTGATPKQFLKEARDPKIRAMWNIQLADSVFKIDSNLDRPKTLTEARAWMKAHGWKSK